MRQLLQLVRRRKNCIQWIEKPSMEGTSALMTSWYRDYFSYRRNAMVEAAYSCGKPALGVGAGNVPAYVEKSAGLNKRCMTSSCQNPSITVWFVPPNKQLS